MANVLIDESVLQGWADTIREKNGIEDKMKPAVLLEKTKELSIGGGSSGDTSGLVKYVTFMSWDGSTELFKMPVLSGDECKDPITHGDIETPTKESTNTENFGYSGWALTNGGSASSSALKNVTEDRIVYASFTASVRYYTVNFYDESTLLNTVQVTYGADASELCKPTKDGYKLSGWIPDVSNVTENITTYAQWRESLLLENASWDTIAEKSADGTASQTWSVGDKKSVTMSDGTTINVVIAGFNHDDLADGSGKAGITFLYDNVYGSSVMLSRPYYECADNWGSSLTMHTTLENQRTNSLPSDLSKHIKPVLKKYYDRTSSDSGGEKNLNATNYMWLLSEKEIGLKTSGFLMDGEGEPYPLFTPNKELYGTNSEMIRYDASGNACQWWLRTKTQTQKYFPAINTTGKKISLEHYKSGYILAGFCI